MKANQCKYYHFSKCKAIRAPSQACILLDVRVKACGWFVLKKEEPKDLADYLAMAKEKTAARKRRGPKPKDPK